MTTAWSVQDILDELNDCRDSITSGDATDDQAERARAHDRARRSIDRARRMAAETVNAIAEAVQVIPNSLLTMSRQPPISLRQRCLRNGRCSTHATDSSWCARSCYYPVAIPLRGKRSLQGKRNRHAARPQTLGAQGCRGSDFAVFTDLHSGPVQALPCLAGSDFKIEGYYRALLIEPSRTGLPYRRATRQHSADVTNTHYNP